MNSKVSMFNLRFGVSEGKGRRMGIQKMEVLGFFFRNCGISVQVSSKMGLHGHY
jgi:hypothetical protein